MQTRRALLLAAAAMPLAGCSVYDSWFGSEKEKLPGKRVNVMAEAPRLAPDAGTPAVSLPAATQMPDAAQAGGTPSHSGGHMAARPDLTEGWTASIGSGGGYRARLTAPPVIAGGRVYAMDSDARVAALDASNGGALWRVSTQAKDDRSTNVGGGLAFADGTLYVATGRADLSHRSFA